MEPYLLPSHPHLTCLDPLSITDSDNPTFWPVIVAHITSFRASPRNSLAHLPALIEDLAYSLHGNGTLDTSFLRQFLVANYSATDAPTKRVLDNILDTSLSLPAAFPSHSVHHLSCHNPIRTLSILQVQSLVAHQLLGTLRLPRGNVWGTNLSCWYSSPQPMENAVIGYLTTLFQYFNERADPSIVVEYEFCSAPVPNVPYAPLYDCHNPAFGSLVLEATDIDSVPFPHGTIDCMLVSSNASPGFGAACTQEELVTAACPDLLPLGAILVSPPIPPAGALFTQNVTPFSRWTGQGRHARLISFLRYRPCSFLFVDAAELDHGSSGFPDLKPTVLQRDLTKVLVGFAALRQRGISVIASPLWGAGSFGGDSIVKSIVLSLAAAFIGIKVHLFVDKRRTTQVAAIDQESSKVSDTTVLRILHQLQDQCQNMTVQEALCLLGTEDALQCQDGWEVAKLFLSMSEARCFGLHN
ncbi:hypothetical protein JOM56_005925 [Amanita muscaria]